MIGIIHYKMGNITSVLNSLEFLHIPARIINSSSDLDGVSNIILPGVGAFPEGMKNLREMGFVGAIQKNVIERKKPFLGICLGMQLLATTGFEGEKTDGLNLISGTVERLPDKNICIPHVGWNNLTIAKENCVLKENSDVYFVHSYYFKPTSELFVLATVDYGVTFAAAVGENNIYGTQFHPEKSQRVGLQILENFCKL